MKKYINRLTIFHSIITGFVAGVFFSTFYIALHYFNFIQIAHQRIIYLLFEVKDKTSVKEVFYFILTVTFFSVIVALFYYFFFKKINHWFVGGLYGVAIWTILYVFIPIVLFEYNPFEKLDNHSNVTMFCLFLLYGVFVGYSISYDYEINRSEIK